MVRILAMFMIAYLLGGCVANMPKDVELVSVEVVDFKYQAELPYRGTAPLHYPYYDFMISVWEKSNPREIYAEEIRPYFSSGQARALQEIKSSRPILKVEFQTGRDLAKLNYNGGFGGAFDAYFCDRPNAPIYWGIPSIHWDGMLVSNPLNINIQRESNGQIVYYAFMNASHDFAIGLTISDLPRPVLFELFDLRNSPDDICFRVRGASMFSGYRSNVVVIPKATIIEAFEQMPDALR